MKTLNAKNKPFTWSYSALNDYQNCPSRYAHARFYCDTPFVESEAIIWGNRVHSAAELTLKGKDHKDPEAFTPVEPYVTAMQSSGHAVEAELTLTLTDAMLSTTWFAEDAWLRAKIDVVVTTDTTVNIYDWKTGKTIRDSPDQLNLNAAMLSVVRPEIELFNGKYIWTAHQQITGIKPIPKKEIKNIWSENFRVVERMQAAWDQENFPARPSGLCPWCPVKDCAKRRGGMR